MNNLTACSQTRFCRFSQNRLNAVTVFLLSTAVLQSLTQLTVLVIIIIIIIIIIRQFIRRRNSLSESLQVQGRRTTSNANTWVANSYCILYDKETWRVWCKTIGLFLFFLNLMLETVNELYGDDWSCSCSYSHVFSLKKALVYIHCATPALL